MGYEYTAEDKCYTNLKRGTIMYSRQNNLCSPALSEAKGGDASARSLFIGFRFAPSGRHDHGPASA
jgi:hypothetical protein